MPVERCEGCPVVGIERKCFALGKLAEMARKEFEDEGKTAKTYEVECPDLYMFQKRNTEMPPSRGPMDDLREVDWVTEVVKRSVTSITTEGESIREAQILDWRERVVSVMADVMGRLKMTIRHSLVMYPGYKDTAIRQAQIRAHAQLSEHVPDCARIYYPACIA